jgi:amino acid adenylation domain-containing protein
MTTGVNTPHIAGQTFEVVRGKAGHLSVWTASRPVPLGWELTGFSGDRSACLAMIETMSAEWFHPECGSPRNCSQASLVSMFLDVVMRHGDRVAVSDSERRITYSQLNHESDRMASALRARGVRDEIRVAVCLPRGVELFVALLAILKAGGVYVPIDTDYPDARRDFMIRSSHARLLIAGAELRMAVAEKGLSVITVDEAAEIREISRTETPVSACQAACVLFTSGSSGEPKAIVLEHRNLAFFALNSSLPKLTQQDRVGQISSVSFDAFNFEAWCTLASGAEVVTMPRLSDLVSGDPQQELVTARVTAMLVPTMAINHIAMVNPDAFSSLRILHTGGDVILPSACRNILSSTFSGVFYNLYGPTEGTTACTAYHLVRVDPDAGSVPIGRPLTGAHVYLLDDDLRPVTDGQVGELYIGGAGVARGYAGKPGLTASRFLPDPFCGDGDRMYATGDLAQRRQPGSALEFIGRRDDQVKVRGYRVEPLEVERVLSRYRGVRDVAVMADGEGDVKYLVALVVGDSVSLKGLRQYAGQVMPEFMVPSAFVLTHGIPANSHGKRDRSVLLQLTREELSRRAETIRPRNSIERYLAAVWEELLGIEEVGVYDDFYALGGNSLLAFRLRQRIARDLKQDIDIHALLAATVLHRLGELLSSHSGDFAD